LPATHLTVAFKIDPKRERRCLQKKARKKNTGGEQNRDKGMSSLNWGGQVWKRVHKKKRGSVTR